MIEKWYRYVEDNHGCYSGYEGVYSGPHGLRVCLQICPVVKHTPCGVWLWHDKRLYGGRWVSKTSNKRWAYPTKKLAWDSFKIRKNRQAGHLRSQLERAVAAISLADEQGEQPPDGDLIYEGHEFKLAGKIGT